MGAAFRGSVTRVMVDRESHSLGFSPSGNGSLRTPGPSVITIGIFISQRSASVFLTEGRIINISSCVSSAAATVPENTASMKAA